MQVFKSFLGESKNSKTFPELILINVTKMPHYWYFKYFVDSFDYLQGC